MPAHSSASGDPLGRLARAGALSAIDVCFARQVCAIAGETRPAVMLAAALASHAVQRGHVCVDLRRAGEAGWLAAQLGIGPDPERPEPEGDLPSPAGWRAALGDSPLVGDGTARTPLVLDAHGRLYLHRYADYQARLARQLLQRAGHVESLDEAALRAALSTLFPGESGESGVDRQRLAALVAALRRFTVVSGGPGTGKTTVVAKLLALLQCLPAARGEALHTLLLAPTGKAAQRLGESISAQLRALPIGPAVTDRIPTRASTIHRALGFRPRTPSRFTHDAQNPLPADVVIVDEASMVDLALMTKLFEAIPERARIILLGDKDQLASVEAGNILGDVYATVTGGYSAPFAQLVGRLTGEQLPVASGPEEPLRDCLIELDRSYRYAPRSGIAALARAIRQGDAGEALAVLAGRAQLPYGDVNLHRAAARDPTTTLAATLREALGPLLGRATPAERLEQLGALRVLCAHRHGPAGAETLNLLVEQRLREAGLITTEGPLYEGRPVLITENDHQLGLFNGDTGVLARDGSGALRAFFPASRAGEPPRALSPARLPPHETVFAMTVHKSQGSELTRVILVLPERPSPVLTRELVYTAVTRARERVDIYGSEEVLAAAIARPTERASGLGDLLWS